MAINVSASPRHYTVDPTLLTLGNPFKCHEEFFYLCSLWSHLNVLTFFPLTGGCSEDLDAFKSYLYTVAFVARPSGLVGNLHTC